MTVKDDRRLRRGTRRGAIYMLVLSTTLIVAVLALTALMIVRLQRQQTSNAADLRKARSAARTGIQAGLLRVKTNSNWRSSYPNGVWELDQSLGETTYTLEGTDPTDGDLADSDTDPLILTSTGKSGLAIQKLQVELESVPQPLEFLGTAVHCAARLRINAGDTLTANGAPASTNNLLRVDGTLDGDGECNTVTNPQNVTGLVTTGGDPKPLPDPGVIATYISRATTLPFNGDLNRDVLTPTLNTYGGGRNADGVYFIDTGGSNFNINRSRVHGTLIVRTGSNRWCTVRNAALVHPYRSDYPSLIVDGRLRLRHASDSVPLDEAALGTNFNPAGAPYLGQTDAALDDVYPNEVQGLVHARYRITLVDTARVRGVLIGEDRVTVNGTNEVVHDPLLFVNPPDQYGNPPIMRLITGSWRRVVN